MSLQLRLNRTLELGENEPSYFRLNTLGSLYMACRHPIPGNLSPKQNQHLPSWHPTSRPPSQLSTWISDICRSCIILPFIKNSIKINKKYLECWVWNAVFRKKRVKFSNFNGKQLIKNLYFINRRKHASPQLSRLISRSSHAFITLITKLPIHRLSLLCLNNYNGWLTDQLGVAQRVIGTIDCSYHVCGLAFPPKYPRKTRKSPKEWSIRVHPNRETRRQVKAQTHFKRDSQVPPPASHRPPDLVPWTFRVLGPLGANHTLKRKSSCFLKLQG